jgi:transposase-like protein
MATTSQNSGLSHNPGVSGYSQSSTKPKTYTPEQKLRIVLESFQRDTTIERVRIKYGVASSVLHRWRDIFKKAQSQVAESAFGDNRNPKSRAIHSGYEPGQSPDDLKKIIGELTIQNEILKKVQGLLG